MASTASDVPVFVTAPRYVLGEIDADHATIPNLHARAKEFGMAPDARTWGWGRIRRTQRSLAAMAIETGLATLAAAAADPRSIDMLVLCSTRFPHGADPQGRFMQDILTGLGLPHVSFAGVTMNRCANLVAALDLAATLIASGQHRRVLVITTDQAMDEEARMASFALFSDGAASCLVLGDNDGQAAYRLVASAAANDARSLGSPNEISVDLARQVNEALLRPRNLTLADVGGLMHGNIFKPVVMMKELQAGFTPPQLYTENITRIGHCFAADPIINLVDRANAGQVRENCYYMLASSVPGSRVGVLLKRLSVASDNTAMGKPHDQRPGH